MRNILLKTAYDGSAFCGWQRQNEVRTVQGEIESALSFILREPAEIWGSSRTDTGVHALGACANFHTENPIPLDGLVKALNNKLPKDVRILSAEEKPEDFHARFSCVGKTYIYQIIETGDFSPFLRNYAWQLVSGALNIASMREAASYLIGEHDFASFMSAGGNVPESTVREIREIAIDHCPLGSLNPLTIRVTGSGFLYHMVRNIVGTLVEIGRGKRPPQDMQAILDARSRAAAGPIAPACGLYLAQVYYL